jgi:hypothetical protein
VSTKQAIYNYDALGRLKEVTFSTGGKITYNYDAMGNRSSVVAVAAGCCFNWLGAWNSATSYDIGDAVSFNGSSYLAVADNSNSQPPSANWNTLAAKGDTGNTGGNGAKGLNWRGAWNSATAYVVDDAVTLNGTSYMAVANNTNSSPPSANWNTLAAKGDTGNTGGNGAKGLNWQGAWNSATAYVVDDAVTLNGTSYIAVANNTNSSPPSANWNTLASKGDQGIQGPAGSGGNKSALKTSDTARTNTTTLADDPHLSIALEANTTYHFSALFTINLGNSGPKFKMTFVGPAGSTISWGANINNNEFHSASGGTSQAFTSVEGGDSSAVCTGSITLGSTAGNLTLQWAQNSSSSQAVTVKSTGLLSTIKQ